MKPVNLNQLLFHSKVDSLTFYQSSLKGQGSTPEIAAFVDDMLTQLNIQNMPQLHKLLEDNRPKILKVLERHPDKSHGFFISEELQGYIMLDQPVESFCMLGQKFHVRPLLEEIFEYPEFILINVSLYDIKVYRGDFHQIEILQQYEFDSLPKNFNPQASRVFAPQYLGLVPYKTILTMKTIAQKISELVTYQSSPVVVTGLDEIRSIFLRYFQPHGGVISHVEEDFYEKTCMEILEKSKVFRPLILDHYSGKFKEKIKRLLKSKRLISDFDLITKAVHSGNVGYLVLPKENSKTDEINDLAEEVIRQGGKIQVLAHHFFPLESSVLAILKGST